MSLFLIDLAIKTSVVLVVSLAGTRLLRRASAASRHALWIAGLAAVVVIGVGRIALPQWRVLVDANFEAMSITPASAEVARPAIAVASVAAESIAPRQPRWTPALSLTSLWLLGTSILLLRLLAGEVGVRRLAQRSRPASDRVVTAAARLCGMLRIGRRVRTLMSHDDCVPITWGALRPVVLLPASADRWTSQRLDAVLAHELAHVARCDALTSFAARAIASMCWCHPLVWWAARQARHESERACDDAVLRAGMRASDYAGELVTLVRELGAVRTPPAAAPAMFGRSSLESRVLAVLDARAARGRASVAIGAAALLLVIASLPLSALTPASAVVPVPSGPLVQGPPPPPPPPVVVPVMPRQPVDFSGTWVALEVERADRLFEVGLSSMAGRMTIDANADAMTVVTTRASGDSYNCTYRFDGSLVTNRDPLQSSYETRTTRSGDRVVVDAYRAGTWLAQMTLRLQGDQLIVEVRTGTNTLTTAYRKAG